MKDLAKSLDDSSCAAARVGPKILSPASRNASTTPAASASTPSRKGKKASDATTESFRLRLAAAAFWVARRTLSMRLIWPAPTPRVMPSRQNTMALDFTYLPTHQAKSRSDHCGSAG